MVPDYCSAQSVVHSESLKSNLALEPFLGGIIPSDEKWVLYNYIERIQQWLAHNIVEESTQSRDTCVIYGRSN